MSRRITIRITTVKEIWFDLEILKQTNVKKKLIYVIQEDFDE